MSSPSLKAGVNQRGTCLEAHFDLSPLLPLRKLTSWEVGNFISQGSLLKQFTELPGYLSPGEGDLSARPNCSTGYFSAAEFDDGSRQCGD